MVLKESALLAEQKCSGLVRFKIESEAILKSRISAAGDSGLSFVSKRDPQCERVTKSCQNHTVAYAEYGFQAK